MKFRKVTLTLLFVTSLVSLSGCAANLPRVSSGLIGCPEKEITVSDDDSDFMGSRTWTATCRGRRYFCNVTKVSQTSSTLACTPEATPAQ